MPHLTEEIWSTFNEELIIDSSWPSSFEIKFSDDGEFDDLKSIINQIRNFKSNYNLKNNLVLDVVKQSNYPNGMTINWKVLQKSMYSLPNENQKIKS